MKEPRRRCTWQALRAIEARAGEAVFSRNPYVKLLPLMFAPPALDWSRAGHCCPTSTRRIVIPAWGRDPIAWDGWKRFAVLAAYAALHCDGVEGWAIDLLTAAPDAHAGLARHDLFAGHVGDDLERLRARGVRLREVRGLRSAGEIFSPYLGGRAEVLLRLDADALLMPAALASCFRFERPLGYSDLNHRHTGRSGLAQLVDPTGGRMRRWPPGLRRTARQWAEGVAAATRAAFGEAPAAEVVYQRMDAVPWPSEGLSYVDAETAAAFVLLREALLSADLVPGWDEEAVKLALIGTRCTEPERCRVPVIEHWEHGASTADCAVVNLRNDWTHGPAVAAHLASSAAPVPPLDYVARIVADLVARARRRGDGA